MKALPSKDIKDSKNVVLLVFDGLGYMYLKKHLKGTIFEKGLKDKCTSVFPPTTPAAITTFATGLSPNEHAFTGWFMHLKELGVVSTILMFNPRIGGPSFLSNGIKISDVLNCRGFSKDLKRSSYLITHKELTDTDFTRYTAEKSRVLGYNSLQEFFKQVSKAIKLHNRKKFIYGYWPEFDLIAHEKGINSKQAKKHFNNICLELTKFLKSVKGTNTKIIITADHGLIDTTKERLIKLEDHPELKKCLSLPLCGEPRVAYCYVHPSKAKKFEKYVKSKLNKFCLLYKSQDLIDKNFFGLKKPDPRLFDRIGDYALIMKENYIIKDRILNKKISFEIGNHGGVSEDEMMVPLVIFDL